MAGEGARVTAAEVEVRSGPAGHHRRGGGTTVRRGEAGGDGARVMTATAVVAEVGVGRGEEEGDSGVGKGCLARMTCGL